MRIPVPLQRGQTLSSAERTAARMNSDRFGIPFIASRSDSGTLNVMISCFSLFMDPCLSEPGLPGEALEKLLQSNTGTSSSCDHPLHSAFEECLSGRAPDLLSPEVQSLPRKRRPGGETDQQLTMPLVSRTRLVSACQYEQRTGGGFLVSLDKFSFKIY